MTRYALQDLPNKVLASKYRLALVDEKVLVEALKLTRKLLETHKMTAPQDQP